MNAASLYSSKPRKRPLIVIYCYIRNSPINYIGHISEEKKEPSRKKRLSSFCKEKSGYIFLPRFLCFLRGHRALLASNSKIHGKREKIDCAASSWLWRVTGGLCGVLGGAVAPARPHEFRKYRGRRSVSFRYLLIYPAALLGLVALLPSSSMCWPCLSFMLPCLPSPAPARPLVLLVVALPLRWSITLPAASSCVVGQKKSAGASLGFRRCSMRFSLFTFSRWRWLEVCGLFGRSLVRRPPVPKASALWDSSPNGRGNSWPCVGQRRPDSPDGFCCRERAPRRR